MGAFPSRAAGGPAERSPQPAARRPSRSPRPPAGTAGAAGPARRRRAARRSSGGTATYALPPSNTPNYIFPFASSTYFSVVNSEDFQYLMYRPLYWFGNGASARR